ncbi:MAG: hypothetical protein QQW96_01460 [Tychonema bourrellyi B0820]|nr:hypothetical protein [Tychonema bourrellyi B0820]
MFLLAKTASAATAALGFAGYFLNAVGVADRTYLILTALVALATVTLIVLTGIRRSNIANTAIVSVTLLSLAVFIVAGLPEVSWEAELNFRAVAGVAGDGASPGYAESLGAARLFWDNALCGCGRCGSCDRTFNPRRRCQNHLVIQRFYNSDLLHYYQPRRPATFPHRKAIPAMASCGRFRELSVSGFLGGEANLADWVSVNYRWFDLAGDRPTTDETLTL